MFNQYYSNKYLLKFNKFFQYIKWIHGNMGVICFETMVNRWPKLCTSMSTNVLHGKKTQLKTSLIQQIYNIQSIFYVKIAKLIAEAIISDYLLNHQIFLTIDVEFA